MADFLTTKAVFKCSATSAARFKPRSISNVEWRGERVLTANDQLILTPPPFCEPLTKNPSTPIPCSALVVPCALLSNQIDDKTASMGKLLTHASSCRCPVYGGATISVSSHSDTEGKFFEKIDAAGASPGSDNKTTIKAGISRQNADIEHSAKDSPGNPGVEKKAVEKKRPDPLDSKVLKCGKCSKKDRCEKPDAIRNFVFKNDSDKLRANYDKRIKGLDNAENPVITADHPAHKIYKRYSEEIIKDYQDENACSRKPWSDAAHHILSGNEILLSPDNVLSDLLALIKAYEYDINCADNCIMLPGFNRGSGEEIRYSAFECMANSKMQWHCGFHAYPMQDYIDKIEKGLKLRHWQGKVDQIKNYKTIVTERMREFMRPYKALKICPLDEAKKRAFIADLNEEIEKIRRELVRFAEKPHHSFPVYVSMEAWRYAFMLPHLSKIIAVTKKNGGLLLEKFNLSRYSDTLESQDGEQLAIGAAKKSGVEQKLLWIPGSGDLIDLVNFCDNTIYFAFGSDLDRRCLGFDISEDCVFPIPGRDSAEYELKKLDGRLLLWLFRHNEKNEGPACGTKVERLAQAKASFEART